MRSYSISFALLFISILCAFPLFSLQDSKSPLLVVVLMVKDEENTIVPTLQPFINAGIDSFIILDTGSSDNTIKNVQECIKKNNLHNAHIFEEPFVNYGYSRNRALQLAEEAFPKSTFMLMVDAEWYLENAQGLLAFCEKASTMQENDSDFAKLYLITVKHTSGQGSYPSPRLFRTRYKIRYNGEIHEIPFEKTDKRIPQSIFFNQSPSKDGDEKSKKRWRNDINILLNDHLKDPKDSRALFNLAFTYEHLAAITNALEDIENAYKYYKERIKLSVGNEEDYMTYYRLGKITERKAKRQRTVSWLEALNYYLQAYNMRPWRIEPLIAIAKHYADLGNDALAYLFSKQTLDIPYPENDILWIEDELYEFYRYAFFSQCAWLVKDYALGEQALFKAIEARPNCLYLYQNLANYWER